MNSGSPEQPVVAAANLTFSSRSVEGTHALCVCVFLRVRIVRTRQVFPVNLSPPKIKTIAAIPPFRHSGPPSQSPIQSYGTSIIPYSIYAYCSHGINRGSSPSTPIPTPTPTPNWTPSNQSKGPNPNPNPNPNSTYLVPSSKQSKMTE